MEYDPISDVIDEPLSISSQTLEELSSFKKQDKFSDLPGNIPGEKERLSNLINAIIDKLVEGIYENPSKLWVMKQFQPFLDVAMDEDTEGREHFAEHLATIMDILEIESSDGLLGFYLG